MNGAMQKETASCIMNSKGLDQLAYSIAPDKGSIMRIILYLLYLSRNIGKGVFEVNTNSKGSDQPAEMYSGIRNFALFCYALQYPVILQADSEGPDQTADVCRLFLAIAVCTYPKTGL